MRRLAITMTVVACAVTIVMGAGAIGAAADVPVQTSGVQVERDLTFRRVGVEDLKLDAFIPQGGGLRPAVIVIFGGGWITGSKELSGPLAEELAAQGYVTFASNYRLAPQHPFPAAIDDVRASVEWVRANAPDYGVDPDRIGAIGGSAGGHLAALLATLGDGPHDRGARVAAAASWAGPMDLRPSLFGPDSQQYLEPFLDCVGRPCVDATAASASPITHVDASDPPLLLADGELDHLVPPDQVRSMAAALHRVGVRHELIVVPGAGHDGSVVPPLRTPTYEFLRRELGDVERAPRDGGAGGGGARSGEEGDDNNLLTPFIVAVVAAVAVGSAAVVTGRWRRRVRY
jgi:acetyl esterase